MSPALPRPLSAMRYILVAVIALAGPGILLERWLSLGLPRMAFIATASAAFVLISLLSGGLRSAAGALMVLGLVACFLGDVLGPGSFLTGVVCFLTGHLMFIAAFALRRGNARRTAMVFALFALISTAVLWGLVGRAEGAEKPMAVAYALVISVMVGFAAGTSHLPGGRLITVGAVVFYVSDIAVAWWKFVGGDFPYDWICYPLYYGACTMLAIGAGLVAAAPPGPGEGEPAP